MRNVVLTAFGTVIMSISACTPVLAQNTPNNLNQKTGYTVRGLVLNELKMPLQGATVQLNNGKGVLTDSAGQFILENIPDKSPLSITYTGYQPFTTKSNQATFITVKLAISAHNISEVNVISTGYQTISRERSTGAFAKVNEATLNQQAGSNIIDRLNGVTSSMLFTQGAGNQPKFSVRGVSSLNGNTSPLIILNNFPFSGDINSINPNDIESVDVLKDAAAVSIWGVAAGNGVIVINTKKGKYNSRLQMNLTANTTFSPKPDFSYLNTISSKDFIGVEKTLFDNGYFDSQIGDTYSHPELSPVVETLLKVKSGELSQADADKILSSLSVLDVKDQYHKYLYKNLLNQQYAFNLHGGDARYSYYASIGYDRNKDQQQSQYDRISFRLDNSFKITKNFSAQAAVFYALSKSTTGITPYGGTYLGYGTQRLYPYAQLADNNGNAVGLDVYRKPFIDTLFPGSLQDWKVYPLNDWQHNKMTGKTAELNTNLNLQYVFPFGLSISGKYQYERQESNQDNYRDLNSFFTRDLINTFSQVNSSTGVISYIVPRDGIMDKSFGLLQAHNLRGQLDYNKTWNHNSLTALIGAELREIITTGNTYRIYGYNPDRLTVANMDYVNYYPNLLTQGSDLIPNNTNLISKNNRYTSFYGNAAYTLKNKYTLSASARRDGSNIFGVSTNNKFKPLWSTGLSWLASEENFWNMPLIPYLKIRATYGCSGNVNPLLTGVTTISYGPTLSPYTNLPYASITGYQNPDLRWEKIGQFNAGIDFEIKSRILTGSIDFYKKDGKDLYGPALVDYTSGIRQLTILKNAASMTGAGVDVVLNSLNINRDFKWKTTLLYNYSKSKITDYYNSTSIGSSFVSNGQVISGMVGQPVYAIVTYKSSGLDKNGDPIGSIAGKDTTNYAAITGNGTEINDLHVHGSALPTSFGNLINTFSYKGFELSINIQYKLGYYFIKSSINYNNLYSSRLGSGDFAKRWQKPGDENFTTVPAMTYPNNPARDNFYNFSDLVVDRADHIRLQYVNLSYNINEMALKKIGITSLQVYGNAANLGIIWRKNKDGVDPDFPVTTLQMPVPPSFTAGIRANF